MPDLTKGNQPDPWNRLGQQPPDFDPVTGQPTNGPAAYSAVDPDAGYTPGYTASRPPLGYSPPPPGYPQQVPPGYAQQGPPGYYPPGYQFVPMYPMAPARPTKPGSAVAAAVLAYVQSGFVLIGGISLFSGANDLGWLNQGVGSELTVVAILTVMAGGLLIAGATTLLNRKPTLLMVGSVLSLAISLYFVVRLADFAGGVAIWVPILFAVLPIISLSLAVGRDVRSWVRAGTHDL